MSYIVKNCPALRGWICNEQFIRQDKMVDCQDCTDCVLKQIVTECKNAKIRANDYARNPYSGGIYDETNRILKLLDIEEVE